MHLYSRITVKPGWKFLLLLLIAHLIVSELHEQAHIQTGYLLCRCYGTRDFVNWSTCISCDTGNGFMVSVAGPLLSYLFYFTGTLLILKRPRNPLLISAGFLLLFAPVPFARFFTALMGGGDEKVFFDYFLNSSIQSRILAILITGITCMIPVVMVSRFLQTRRWLWISVFCLMPMFTGFVYQRVFLNQLLSKGWLSETHILGTPDLILIHWTFVVVLFILFRKWIRDLKVSMNYGKPFPGQG